jgi:hypothetical protein
MAVTLIRRGQIPGMCHVALYSFTDGVGDTIKHGFSKYLGGLATYNEDQGADTALELTESSGTVTIAGVNLKGG